MVFECLPTKVRRTKEITVRLTKALYDKIMLIKKEKCCSAVDAVSSLIEYAFKKIEESKEEKKQ